MKGTKDKEEINPNRMVPNKLWLRIKVKNYVMSAFDNNILKYLSNF